MEIIVSLVVVPCIAALLMLAIRTDKVRDILAVGFAVAIGVLSIVFSVMYLGSGPVYFELPAEWSGALSMVNFAIEMAVGAFILAYAIRYKRILPLVLALVQIIIAIWLETSVMHEVGFSTQLRIDELSIIMGAHHRNRRFRYLRVCARLHEGLPEPSC